MVQLGKNRFVILGLLVLIGSLLAACGGSGSEADAESAGGGEAAWDKPVVFGDGGFASVQFHNRVAQYVLENGYGYETESIPAENITRITGLINGDIHATMEMWADQTPDFAPAVEEGTVIDLGPNYPESVQGWYVPTYMIEGDPERGIEPMTPDLKSVEDLAQYAHVFQDPEIPEKGRFYNCIGGWVCAKVNDGKLKAYGLDDDFNSFMPGSGPALAASLVGAYETGEPWLGYYWAPTWIFARLDLTQIEEPEYTDECWDKILTGTVGCAYPSVKVHVAVTDEFAEKAPDATAFLDNYESTMESTNEVLFYIHDNEATVEQAAIWWLENNEDIWTEWATDEAVEGVQEALEAGTGF
jgi:glycine betaine/proline transport system substrate-binding protein